MNKLNISAQIPAANIAQISATAQPTALSKLTGAVVYGNYAYVSGTAAATVSIYNVANPASPRLLSITSLAGSYGLSLAYPYLLVPSDGGSSIYLLNVSNPAAPTVAGSLLISGTPGSIYSGVLAGSYAYLATQNKGLTVVNVSNPAALVQTFQEGGTLNKSFGVAVSGQYVYTTNYQTTSPWTVRYLKIWSIASNPAVPTLLTTYTLPAGTKPGGVQIFGSLAFVVDLNTNSFQIIDISNPLAPVYLSSLFATNLFDTSNQVAISVGLDGTYAYVGSGSNATYGGSIDFFDITNPSAPVKVSTYQEGIPGSVFGGIVLYNNLLYVADYGVAPGSNGYLRIYSTQNALSGPVLTRDFETMSAQVSVTSTGTAGTFMLQGSDDPTNPPSNWSPLPGTGIVISATGTTLIPAFPLAYQYIRSSFVSTGSAGLLLTEQFNGNN